VIDVRPCGSLDELRRAFVIWHYFGADPTEEEAERFARLLPLDRMHAAWEGDLIVGGAGAFPLELSVPGGGRVGAVGVTAVGVLPTHRRRGILRQLMRAQLADVHARGEAVACLWASEGSIYGRFGYGIGTLQGSVALPRERTAFARAAQPYGAIRLVSAEEAMDAFPQVYDRVLAERPGMLTRTPEWWETRPLADDPERRGGAGPKVYVLLEADGRPEAYAAYRIRQSFEGYASTGSLLVLEALGATPAATRALWRWLLDMDWTAKIEVDRLPVDHPLLQLLAEPRRLRMTLVDALWVRLVDVGAALSGRGYAGDGEVVLELRDELCPWNEGRWRVGPGGAERSDAESGLALDVAALGSAYLGAFTFRQLADAERLEEREAGAIARADAIFRVDRAPWCLEIF
jgi:predicted acetyltransferase